MRKGKRNLFATTHFRYCTIFPFYSMAAIFLPELLIHLFLHIPQTPFVLCFLRAWHSTKARQKKQIVWQSFIESGFQKLQEYEILKNSSSCKMGMQLAGFFYFQ